MASLFRVSLGLRTAFGVRGVRCSAALLSGPYSSGGGHVRDAGGAFGERERAQEEAYFRKQTQEQLRALKERLVDEKGHHEDEIKMHEDQIKRHQEAINRHKKKIEQHEHHHEAAHEAHEASQ